ncbi:hypothetical protein [Streptococcus ferus]|uniref:hypothetical protein n=1 Tax=Streptococcus ferus TaxID=1345 RepID=UPI0035A074CF
MADNDQQEERQSYGMPRDLFASVKMYGVRIISIAFVGVSTALAMQLTGSGKVFPKEQFLEYCLFVILTFFMTLYLMFPFNGGKNNLHAIRIFLTRRRKFYRSLNRLKRNNSR